MVRNLGNWKSDTAFKPFNPFKHFAFVQIVWRRNCAAAKFSPGALSDCLSEKVNSTVRSNELQPSATVKDQQIHGQVDQEH